MLLFGKFKGKTVSELQRTEKGRQYISWLLRQEWFTENKFSAIYKALDASKKNRKKAMVRCCENGTLGSKIIILFF